MTRREIKDMAASVKSRLLAVSQGRGESFDLTLTSYALERLLYRLSQSPYRDRFVLKGAMVFAIWTKQPHRSTRDLDLLGWGDSAVPSLEVVFREVCSCQVDNDGLQFLPETVRGGDIREEQEYGGVRIHIQALLGKARIPIRINIGFGDAVTPEPEVMVFPTLLDFPAPVLSTYPREAVAAEKYHAIVVLGMTNSRMKDYYDLWVLASSFEFDGETLCKAFSATFKRRQTPMPEAIPVGLSDEFGHDSLKQSQWQAFIRKGKLTMGDRAFPEIVSAIRDFLMPPTLSAVERLPLHKTWHPQGPWKSET